MIERIEQSHQNETLPEAEAMDAVEAVAMEAEKMVDMVPPNEESSSSSKQLTI